ncbi:MAG: hypothetical protein JNJ81_11175 [Candidatus Accumulibacter sp.]|nr:hypothetical protein [Accumulibacter sp.]
MSELNASLAAAVARAKRDLDGATKTHAAAVEKVQQITGRIAETTTRREAITSARLAGKSTPAEASEQSALGEDLTALQRLHGAAQVDADALQPAVEAARSALASAEGQWSHHQAEVAYNALLARTREHEAALLAVVEATLDAGKKLGHVRPRQSWMPTDRLSRAVTTGAL